MNKCDGWSDAGGGRGGRREETVQERRERRQEATEEGRYRKVKRGRKRQWLDGSEAKEGRQDGGKTRKTRKEVKEK